MFVSVFLIIWLVWNEQKGVGKKVNVRMRETERSNGSKVAMFLKA